MIYADIDATTITYKVVNPDITKLFHTALRIFFSKITVLNASSVGCCAIIRYAPSPNISVSGLNDVTRIQKNGNTEISKKAIIKIQLTTLNVLTFFILSPLLSRFP